MSLLNIKTCTFDEFLLLHISEIRRRYQIEKCTQKNQYNYQTFNAITKKKKLFS